MTILAREGTVCHCLQRVDERVAVEGEGLWARRTDCD
jgi:hypothetical protein